MICLKFDADKMFKDMVDECILPAAQEAMEVVYKEIYGKTMAKSKRKSQPDDIQLEDAFLNYAANEISVSCATYGWAVLESFGTGPKMDLTNQELANYISGELWNPLRTDTTIVGRKEGSYVNFFGESAESTGSKAGKSIGGWGKGIKPTHAIQNAEKKLDRGVKEGGFVHRIIHEHINTFLSQDLSKYFDDGR